MLHSTPHRAETMTLTFELSADQDYEGYREVARSRGIETVEVAFGADPKSVSPGHWFLSNPSARDGNVLPPAVPLAILEAGHKVFYDLSNLGATDPSATFDLSHPGIFAAAISFSKPYGLFYYRVGFTFAKQEVPALFANKWFKNVYGLLIAERILRELDLRALAARYKNAQAEIVAGLNLVHGLGLRASDAFLLVHLSDEAALAVEQQHEIKRFRRDSGYRFCLTPFFQKRER